MSQYTKSTNFATKDNLTPGDPLKVVRGTEIDTEYNNIATAIATKTDNASAAITGGTITGITDLAIADGGTGASTAAGALNNLLPSQTSNANKYLQTDGTNATWDAVSLSTADITGTLAVANGGTGVTSSTGTGSVVLSNSPTLVTPVLGTPSSGTATNLTGLPISTGVSGLGTGVATALAVNVGSTGAPVVNGGVLGTPSGGTLTNATGLPIATGVSGLGTGVATFLATPSSANLAAALTDETGTGSAVFATSPTLVTPTLGVATGTSFQGIIGNVTPAAGAFTTLSASGATTLSAQLTASTSDTSYPIISKDTSAFSAGVSGPKLGFFGLDSTSTNTALGAISTLAQASQNATLRVQVLNSGSLATIGTFSTTGLGIGTSNPDARIDAEVSSGNGYRAYKSTTGGFTAYRLYTSNENVIGTVGVTSTNDTFYLGYTSTPVLTWNQNCVGVGGATPSTSGAGITFPATQSASSNANTLDDYEEGTWTPTLSFLSGSVTYTTQAGIYTKVGRIVTVEGYVNIATASSPSTFILMQGLPFAPATQYGAASIMVNGMLVLVAGDYVAHPRTAPDIRIFTFSAGSLQNPASNIQAGSEIYVTCSYAV
jgi:hypothetical protein